LEHKGTSWAELGSIGQSGDRPTVLNALRCSLVPLAIIHLTVHAERRTVRCEDNQRLSVTSLVATRDQMAHRTVRCSTETESDQPGIYWLLHCAVSGAPADREGWELLNEAPTTPSRSLRIIRLSARDAAGRPLPLPCSLYGGYRVAPSAAAAPPSRHPTRR
jgi:hypothetical protein